MVLALMASALAPLRNRSSRLPVWGDGFESDGVDHLARVADWDMVSNDELIRIFPRLLGVESSRPIAHMERCLAALFVRSGSAIGGRLKTPSAGQANALGSMYGAEWAPAPTRHYCEGLLAGELSTLDDVLSRLRVRNAPPFQPEIAEIVAFHTGIHPAYFWAEAIGLHDRLTSFAWLGIVMRGRRALMPLDVAEYLHVFGADPQGDERLLRRLGSPRDAALFLRQAAKRLYGREVVAACSSAGFSWTSAPWCMT